MRLLVDLNGLFIKLSFDESENLKGFEVYSGLPKLRYWTENYGHEEPLIVWAGDSFYLPFDGKYLAFWYTMNVDTSVSGVELIKTEPTKSKDATRRFSEILNDEEHTSNLRIAQMRQTH